MDIEQIIQGCKSGNRSCQEALVRTFAPRLLAVCKRYCKESNMADDALQETFINAFKYMHTYSGTGSFEGWLRRIAVTKSIELNKKFFQFPLFSIQEEVQVNDVVIPDVFSQLGEEELLSLVKTLPENQYIVFNLYVVEGYSHQEIASIMSIAEGSSRALLSRARSTLMSVLKARYASFYYPMVQL